MLRNVCHKGNKTSQNRQRRRSGWPHGAAISSVHTLSWLGTILDDTLYCFFQLSIQSSKTCKFSMLIFLTMFITLVFKRAETPSSLLWKNKSHLKIAWSNFAKKLSFNWLQFALFHFLLIRTCYSYVLMW